MLLGDQARHNGEFWLRGDHVDFYAGTELRPVERVLLARHRAAFAGCVLELGCGAGRLTRHLLPVARELHGVDLSEAMIAHCRRTCPGGVFYVGDIRDLSAFGGGRYSVIVAPYNVLDVFGDRERRAVLRRLQTLLTGGGLLVFSSHNRAFGRALGSWTRLLAGNPRRPLHSMRRLPLRLRNRRQLLPLEWANADYAIRNDAGHDFSLLHYHITRDAQERQLGDCEYELLECLDLDGRLVEAGANARACPELHYVARS